MARRHGRAESSRPTQKKDRPSPRADAICPYDKALRSVGAAISRPSARYRTAGG